MHDALSAVETAMVAIRRSQTRRALARSGPTGGVDPAVFDVVDAVEGLGDRATVMAVAAALDVAQPRASKLVAAAVEAGWLRREADQADGRRSLLVRTAAGLALSERVHAARRARFAAATAGWPPADLDRFAQLLTRFVAGLTETAADRH
ncbi:winged helix-turn-helix transcriptional regulator [Dactylosporangium aurantiacum]|uniref:Winged helix-turn-helix transcriptional regulator n=1 Tax=Dactylosporangium aurantiacum TaxID=35754 RepID=A0A9Q9IJ43_9ACTN|nr:MarR family winged helix-turn-helix transcriptional regulator [Dactylosporangium aurantiacum]MDG6102004.1 MarR family winged helix-turn-helix transcriptional regulator [Dactylosporangium aurantiacum]UWZ53655.1 winged helix-turn-helix transcriptional regulator [Dactylosporangium aurantiacum]